MRHYNRGPRLVATALTLLSILIAGCTTTAKHRVPSQLPNPVITKTGSPAASDFSSTPSPVVRYDRYTLVELIAQPAQRDLMQQIVEITVPPNFDATVGDALHYVLLRSGYRLCANTAATPLYTLPVPAAHLHLGPLTLQDALLTLAGPAWDLSIDDAFRQVCFEPHPSAPTLEVQP